MHVPLTVSQQPSTRSLARTRRRAAIACACWLTSLAIAPAPRAAAPTPASSTSGVWGRVPAVFISAPDASPSAHIVSTGSSVPFFFTAGDVRMVLQRDGRHAALFLELVNASSRPALRSPAATTITHLAGNRGAVTREAYREVVYPNAWPGIDAMFRDEGGRLVYEFLLAPGARIEDVRLQFHGVDSLALDDAGNLLIATPLGTLVDEAPTTFQIVDGRRVPVDSRYELLGVDLVGFSAGAYDRSRPLLIDPSIAYATFLGGSGDDTARGIAVDAVGAAYVVGATTSSNLPVVSGMLDTTRANIEGFVAKLSPSGDAFEYVTYLGGSLRDELHGIAVDAGGNAYVAGFTASDDFPVTAKAFRTTKGSSAIDGVVAKLNPHGTALLYSTYLGGNATTVALDIAVDSADQAHVTGYSGASNLPATSGAIQPTIAGADDAFLLKFDASGASLRYATYLGGAQSDQGNALALDRSGHVYLAGLTQSSSFPVTAGAPQRALRGAADAFVTKVDPSGATSAQGLRFSTYLGGSNTDYAEDIVVSAATQESYVAVTAFSADITPGIGSGGVLFKLNALGGVGYIRNVGPERIDSRLAALALDSSDTLFAAGFFNDSDTAGFVSRLDPHGVEAARVLIDGNSPYDPVVAVAVDDELNAYIAGHTDSTVFPVTGDAAQRQPGGALDGFVAKVSFADVAATNVAEDRSATASSIEHAQYAPHRAFDGDFSTRWSSAFSDPQWIAVDLGQRYRVDRVVLHWETAYGLRYELQISDDGVNWYPLRAAAGRYDDEPPAANGGVDNHINLIGTGRYVRMFGLARGTPWGYSLWEMQVFGTPVSAPAPPPGTVNLALKAPVATSSVERASLNASHAVDGDMRTRWSSGFSDPQWIRVDLGGRVNVSRVVLRWETAFARDYQIQVSDDGVAWTTVRTVTGGDGGVDDLTGLSGKGRFVRMFGTRRATGWGYSLFEFEVYGVINDGGPPTPVKSDIVLYGADDIYVSDAWIAVSDSTAAGGRKMSTTDSGRAWTEQPPPFGTAPYAEYVFTAPEAGTYRLWIRLRARGDTKWNDSVWIQFSDAMRDGAPVYRVRSSSGLLVNLEDCSGCGVRGWGWQDNSWWLGQSSLVDLPAGTQRLYVIVREDGVEFDQIVLSPERFRAVPPGGVRDDTTIGPR